MLHAEIYFAHSENNDGQWNPLARHYDAQSRESLAHARVEYL